MATDTAIEGALQVWWVRNPPRPAEYHEVSDPLDAAAKLKDLAERDLRTTWVISNAGGLEVFEDGEWTEWYNEEGQDIDEAFDL